jgi:hypothetical protein
MRRFTAGHAAIQAVERAGEDSPATGACYTVLVSEGRFLLLCLLPTDDCLLPSVALTSGPLWL